MLSAENYADIEVLAYEAAIIPELWPRALGRLGDISDSVGGGIVCLNERGTHIVCVPEMDQARLQILEGGYMTRSGRAAGVIERGLVGAPRFSTSMTSTAASMELSKTPSLSRSSANKEWGGPPVGSIKPHMAI